MKKYSRRFRIISLVTIAVIFSGAGIGLWRVLHAPKTVESAPLAVATPSYGIAAGGALPYLSDEQLTAYMQGVKALGVDWVRYDIDWSVVQPRNATTFDWHLFDRVVSAANTAGLRSLVALTHSPQWARGESCMTSAKCPPGNPYTFAAFVGAAARRYSPQGVKAWEIWNEPNSRISWAPAANPAAYTKVLKASYQAVHYVDPQAIVLTGGVARVGDTTGNIQGPEFLSRLYDSGARGSFDGVASHPYSYPYLPTFRSLGNAWLQLGQAAYNIRDVMSSHGDAYKKVWITEYGAPTLGPGRMATDGSTNVEAGSDHISETLQATMVTTAVGLYKNIASWSGPMFWDSYQDNGPSTSNVEHGFGLVRYDGSHKPAYEALQQAMAADPPPAR